MQVDVSFLVDDAEPFLLVGGGFGRRPELTEVVEEDRMDEGVIVFAELVEEVGEPFGLLFLPRSAWFPGTASSAPSLQAEYPTSVIQTGLLTPSSRHLA